MEELTLFSLVGFLHMVRVRGELSKKNLKKPGQ